jgi:hypothetical protein
MSLLNQNIATRGRRLRAAAGVLLALGTVASFQIPWLAALLGISSVFVLFEAWRGWCVLRACGIRTRW